MVDRKELAQPLEEKISKATLAERQGRYLELTNKIIDLVLLSDSELAELILVRRSLQREATKKTPPTQL